MPRLRTSSPTEAPPTTTTTSTEEPLAEAEPVTVINDIQPEPAKERRRMRPRPSAPRDEPEEPTTTEEPARVDAPAPRLQDLSEQQLLALPLDELEHLVEVYSQLGGDLHTLESQGVSQRSVVPEEAQQEAGLPIRRRGGSRQVDLGVMIWPDFGLRV